MNAKATYTTAEAAETLETTIRTLSRWLKDGIIEGTKRGKYWHIPADEVERMRKSRETYRKKGQNGATL